MGRSVAKNLIANQFADVTVAQDLLAAQRQIKELTTEIESLKRMGNKAAEDDKIAELRSSLQSTVTNIPITQIEPNRSQPRQTFNDDDILLLARSLERDGQQQPILVFQKEDNEFLLFDGERRWRAAQSLKWPTIKTVIVPRPELSNFNNRDTLRRKALLANLHRENINSLDLAEALISELSTTYSLKNEEIPKLLDAVIVRLSRKKQTDLLTKLVSASDEVQQAQLSQLEQNELIKREERIILQFLLSLQLNPTSIKTNVFPSLKFFADLKDAVRKKGLGTHHAKELQKLSSKNLKYSEKKSSSLRGQGIEMVLKQKLSVKDTRKLVKEYLSSTQTDDSSKLIKEVKTALDKIQRIDLNKFEPDILYTLEHALEQKLKEVKKILSSK